MGYVYIKSEPNLWTVGHYNPKGEWIPESDHATPKHAGARVHFLNGGDLHHHQYLPKPELRER